MYDYQGEDLKDLVNEGVVLVDFFATWCNPCKMILPQLEQLKKEREDINIVKVNVDDYRDLAVNNKVSSIPTLVLFKDGVEVDRRGGFAPKDAIEKWIDSFM